MATKMGQSDFPVLNESSDGQVQQPPASGRFPKTERLLKRPSFLRLANGGKKIHTRLFLAVTLEGETAETRLGVTVTRKVGSAVRRNRIKRLVRDFFRLNRDGLPPGVDINVIAKKAAVDAEAKQVRATLKEIFGQIQGRVLSKH